MPSAQVHAVGGKLVVDSTFGPPPLQDPFKWGADVVMHSGKFLTRLYAYVAVLIMECSSYQVSWRSLGFVGWGVGR